MSPSYLTRWEVRFLPELLTINNNNMGGLRDEIAYLEYGKKYAELTAGEQREVECQYDDLVNTY